MQAKCNWRVQHYLICPRQLSGILHGTNMRTFTGMLLPRAKQPFTSWLQEQALCSWSNTAAGSLGQWHYLSSTVEHTIQGI